MNTMKTFLLMFGLMALLMFIGSFFGRSGMLIALGLGSTMNFAAYWWSDKIVLRMNGAKEVTQAEAPDLYAMVHELTQKVGLPMPKLYIIPMGAPNAFATGRNPSHAAVAVSPALLQMLSRDEVKGVLAHELAHVQNRDVLISTIAACVAGAISYLAHMAQWAAIFGGFGRSDDEEGSNPVSLLVMAIVAPIAALIIQLAISRSREFHADATGAHMTGQPRALANALRKIHQAAEIHPTAVEPASASLYIANPLTGRKMMSWFSTHPDVKERVARLEGM